MTSIVSDPVPAISLEDTIPAPTGGDTPAPGSGLIPKVVYQNLQYLEHGDIALSALFRQAAQDILADSTVGLAWKTVIADRLNRANQRLSRTTTLEDSSY